jgi:hypothetical protein
MRYTVADFTQGASNTTHSPHGTTVKPIQHKCKAERSAASMGN